MIESNRRRLIQGMALAGATLATGAVFAAPVLLKPEDIKKEAAVACLYHCDFGELPRFGQMLDNIVNHYAVYNADPFEIQIVIVAHGPGIKYFLTDLEKTPWNIEIIPEDVFARVQGLSKNGLIVYLCDITFEKLNIDRGKVRKGDFLKFVPSGVATVAALQTTKDFAYLKVA